MGMFNRTMVKLKCPILDKLASDCEIQFKWQDHYSLMLTDYKIGDLLEDLLVKYNNIWIRVDYICTECSKKSNCRFGPYIKTEDQSRHFAYVLVEECKLIEIISEADFKTRNINNFVIYD